MVVEGLYYPCSENKGADQLRGYREADLRLCFRICKKPVSHDEAHLIMVLTGIKFPFKRKACKLYEGGCCRQVSTVVSLVVW